MNGPRSIPAVPVWVPEKIATRTLGSIALVIRPIARAMLMTKPVFVSIARMPAPIPRLFGGMTPMTALVLGELNRPDPAPMISCHRASCQYGRVDPDRQQPGQAGRGDEHPQRWPARAIRSDRPGPR